MVSANPLMTTTRSASKSSAEHPTTTSGVKRKERDFDQDLGEDTNIHVVVRCRGRNEVEVRENSGVSVITEGVKGKVVELSTGPTAVSNKTCQRAYAFDRVFSSAADQRMVYEDVVAPMLDEVSIIRFPFSPRECAC